MLLHFQCINHPPLFLGWSLAFGQEGRKHMARWTKLSELIHYLQIQKTVALEKGHLSKEAGWGALGGTYILSAIGIAGVTQTQQGSFQHQFHRKG